MDAFLNLLFSDPKYLITIALCVFCMVVGVWFLAEIIHEFVWRR